MVSWRGHKNVVLVFNYSSLKPHKVVTRGVTAWVSPVEAWRPDEALHHLGCPGQVVMREHRPPLRPAPRVGEAHRAALVDAHAPQPLVWKYLCVIVTKDQDLRQDSK